jgi:hypothetical protein
MATKLRPVPNGRPAAGPRKRDQGGPPRPKASSASHEELARLRDMVEDQHRRLRLIRSQMADQGLDDALVETFTARCAKPRLSHAALARLVEEARLRLELQDSALGTALRASWPERRPEVPVLRPSPGLAAYALRNVPGVPNVVLALFGKSGSELKRTIERVIAEQQGAEPFIPVFLTNHHDFTPFRDQRLAFEYFPFLLDEAATAPDPRWVAYFLDTLELSLRRWGVRQVLWP